MADKKEKVGFFGSIKNFFKGVKYMSFINENISVKIREVRFMSWDIASVQVAARPYHALALRLCGSASFSNGNINSNTNTGDVFYMPANCSYKATYQEKNEILVIHFESDLISEMELRKAA